MNNNNNNNDLKITSVIGGIFQIIIGSALFIICTHIAISIDEKLLILILIPFALIGAVFIINGFISIIFHFEDNDIKQNKLLKIQSILNKIYKLIFWLYIIVFFIYLYLFNK